MSAAYLIKDKSNDVQGIVTFVDKDNVTIDWSDERTENLTNEELASLLDLDNYEVEEVELVTEDSTPAQASIAAHTTTTPAGVEGDGNPKTRLDWIRAVVGSLASASEDSLEKMYFDAIHGDTQDTFYSGSGKAGVNNAAEHATEGKVDGNQHSIDMKPSAAVGQGWMKTEQDAIFGETTLTEEAQNKISTLFEAAVTARVTEEIVKLQEQYNTTIDEEIKNLTESFEDKIAAFLDRVVEEWMEENIVPIQSTLTTELTHEFIGKLHSLFEEHYISIPEESVDVLEAVVLENEELKTEINDRMNENIEKDDVIKGLQKTIELGKLSEGLTLVQKQKLVGLVESTEFKSVEDFTKKVNVIKEGFKLNSKDTGILTEQLPEDTKTTSSDPAIERLAAMI